MSYDQSGLCPHCQSRNLYSDFNCRVCGQRLPWADAMTQKLFEGKSVAQGFAYQPPDQSRPFGQTPDVVNAESRIPLSARATPSSLLSSTPRNICPHCGGTYAADANYCSSCGVRIWEGMHGQRAVHPLTRQEPTGSHQLATPEKGDFTRTFFVAVFFVFAGWMMITGSMALLPLVVIVLCFAVLCRLLR